MKKKKRKSGRRKKKSFKRSEEEDYAMKDKVIVCGTRFGQFYMEAVKNSAEMELMGVVSTGSEQSREVAEHYGAVFYKGIDNIPEGTTMAAVAVKTDTQGGTGSKLVQEFLEKGIPVILEQPVTKKELVDLYKISVRSKVGFTVGDHYYFLPAIEEFIQYAKALIKEQDALYINVDMATQVSFSCCHVLAGILGANIKTANISKTDMGDYPFQSAMFLLNNIPVNIRAQNQVAADVSDNYMHLFFKIEIGFPTGALVLEDVHGPVYFRERMTVPNIKFVPGDLVSQKGVMKEGMVKILYMDETLNYADALSKDWTIAIEKELTELRAIHDGGFSQKEVIKKSSLIMTAAGLWSSVMDYLGYPTVCENPKRDHIPFEKIRRLRFRELDMDKRESLLSKEQIDICAELLNRTALLSMIKTFQNANVFAGQKDSLSEDEIIKRLPHKSRNEYVITRWLKVLVREGILQKNDNEYSLCIDASETEKLPQMWEEVRDRWCDQSGPESVFDYFYRNSLCLNELFTGEKTATQMLFTEGGSDIADELYQNTMIAFTMNRYIAEAVADYVRNKEKGVRILEIGAGTGATSKVIWKKLKDLDITNKVETYLFTDLSSFFLDAVKAYSDEYPFIKTRILDAEKLDEYSDISKNSFDIIVAAGVINNVNNTPKTLISIKELLKEDGVFLMSEATGESIPMLISQVFMMDEASDDRKESDSTFLCEEQWDKYLADAGFICLDKHPDKGHKFEAFGQKAFMLTRKGETE